MDNQEKTIQFLEEHIPELASAATTQAYWQALAAGHSVLVAEDGEISEVFPDGTVKPVKKSPPLVAVEKGAIIKLK